MDNRINNINNQKSNTINQKPYIPYEIRKSKTIYDDFIKKMNESDFWNTDKRYIAELIYVRKLISLYEEKNIPIYLQDMKDREAEIQKKLEVEFGVKYKDS